MTRRLLTACALWVFHVSAQAGDLERCFESAAERYGIAAALLRAIAVAESGLRPNALGRNPDGSWDVGLMQINSWWLPTLARYGIREADLWEPCLNVQVGAWILAWNIARYGYTWEAVGAYNAGTADTAAARRRRENYAYRVLAHLGDAARGLRDETANRGD